MDMKQSVDGAKKFIVTVLTLVIVLFILISIVIFKTIIPNLSEIISLVTITVGAYLGGQAATDVVHKWVNRPHDSSKGQGENNASIQQK